MTNRVPHFARMAAATLVAVSLAAPLAAQESQNFFGTWSASPQPVWEPDFFAAAAIPRSLRDQTVRQVARISQGGEAFRIELSNRYGTEPLVIGRARVAIDAGDGAIEPGTDTGLTFSGDEGFAVPPGAVVWSDPVRMPVEDLAEIAVSLYLPEVTPLDTWHNDGRQTTYVSANGDMAEAESFEAAEQFDSRLFLSGIQIAGGDEPASVVLFGDSITDGDSSTPNANNRWPDILAERIVEAGSEMGVLNEGISGARLLRDRMGVNALARFDDDVLLHPHAEVVVIMIGINDIGWPRSPLTDPGEPAPSVEDLIAGYEQLVARAHTHGMQVIGATLTPFNNAFEGDPLEGYYSDEKEAKRSAVNEWIRTGGAFDGVIDFDEVVRDPDDPTRIRVEYDSGDHLHPNDAGYEAMARAVDLSLLGIEG
ncbi:SGNH/GDSL hydrolase family protein [uncultured Jannaschia sp.]|uniref:SGNH/GDSL hydrolase family protein n=1 Tax=uncultured Jannaschia sp. TaxID=293347 RepID=UPI00261F6E69|nr:SGNH/GDSL hydrolase family protein [uncultured Jannaschia sp.]